MTRFVVVESDGGAAEHLVSLLRDQGWPATVVRRKAELAAQLNAAPIEGLILDPSNQDFDMTEVARLTRAAHPGAALFACARISRKGDLVNAIRLGFTDWLDKPVGKTELAEMLERRRARPTSAGDSEGPAPARSEPPLRDTIRHVVEAVRDGTIAIPQMPQVVLDLREMLSVEDVVLEEVVRRLESDPGIASRVLAMANSATFGGRMRIQGLSAAVTRLGTRHLSNLVETAALPELFPTSKGEMRLRFQQLWARTVTCACLARRLAERTGRVDQDEAYLLALLQDVGELFLLSVLGRPEHAGSGLLPGDAAAAAAHWHPHFGAALTGKWNLGPAFAETARRHHDADLAAIGDEELRTRLHLLNLAQRLAARICDPAAAEPAGAPQAASLEALGFTLEQLADLLEEGPAILAGVIDLAG